MNDKTFGLFLKCKPKVLLCFENQEALIDYKKRWVIQIRDLQVQFMAEYDIMK